MILWLHNPKLAGEGAKDLPMEETHYDVLVLHLNSLDV